MKIVHLCMAGSYNDYWSYQDNLLPIYHKKAGNDVSIITTSFINSKQKSEYIFYKTGEYIDNNGIKIIRKALRFSHLGPITKLTQKLRLYKNLYESIAQEKPDILFVHCCQFLDMNVVKSYKIRNEHVKIYVDNHADFSNSAKTWFSKNIIHKIIWKYCAKQIEPYVERFYGVLPARVEFLSDVYGIAKDKIDLLLMGADDVKVQSAAQKETINFIREKNKINTKDFLIVTGGKIDVAKQQTLLLMKAIKEMEGRNIRLIVFGSVETELKDDFMKFCDNDKIQYIGWINSEESYDYFSSADLVVFPGRHSVFWEQVVAQGKPLLVKYWEGTGHIDIGGNCKYLYQDNVEEIKKAILDILKPDIYIKMVRAAQGDCKKQFLYSNIAERSIR